MRIANSSPYSKGISTTAQTAFLIALGLLPLALPAESFAQAAAPLPTTVVAAPAAPAAAPTPVASSVPAAAAPGVAVDAPAPAASIEPAKVQGADIAKSLSSMEDRVTENAKAATKRLDTSTTDTTTLADLNSIRQTVTRIDAMIDVEKRLVELEKLRSERTNGARISASANGGSSSSLAGAIPASALSPLPRPAQLASANGGIPVDAGMRPGEKHVSAMLHPEIVRIYGTEGKYTAVLKTAGGDVKTVRVGDQLASGETVRTVTPSSVHVEGKGNSYTLHVKNVDAIYSAMR